MKKLDCIKIVLIICIFFVVYFQHKAIKELTDKNNKLVKQIEATKNYYTNQFEDVKKANSLLQKELTNLKSNECGKEEVPEYLLNSERNLLKGL